MLEMYGVDASHINRLMDDRPLADDELETLQKILYRLPFLGLEQIQAWCRSGASWSDLAEAPERYRIEVFKVEGRVTAVERTNLSPEAARRLDYDHYFRVRIRLKEASSSVLACARQVPEAWLEREVLDERASLYGLFLKAGSREQDGPELVFAARRIAWHPDREDGELGITADHVVLGDLGMDVGLFDDVRPTNRKALGPADRECFYQMLAATRRADVASLNQRASKSFDVQAMLTRPETRHGRLTHLTGTAKRVQRIAVSEADIQQRFGIDHYYQIDVFVPLGDVEVRLGAGKEGQETPVFANNYPVTCCALDLPRDLPAEDNIGVPIDFTGFFLKLWAYRTEYVSSFNPQQRQVGPLFIAATPRVIDTSSLNASVWGWVSGSVILVILGYVVFSVWILPRRDRRVEREMRWRSLGAESGPPVIPPAAAPAIQPDFGGLQSGQPEQRGIDSGRSD
jgi:hypothetical protein